VGGGICFEGAAATFPINGFSGKVGVWALGTDVGVIRFGVETMANF